MKYHCKLSLCLNSFSIYQSHLKHNYAIQTESCLLNESLLSPKYLEDLYLDFSLQILLV